MTEERDYYRSLVVWRHDMNELPSYHQGAAGEHEINEPVTAKEVSGLLRLALASPSLPTERAFWRCPATVLTAACFAGVGIMIGAALVALAALSA